MLLDLTTQTTTRLGLEPIKKPQGGYAFNGCIPTRVTEVHVTTQKHEKGEFKDLEVPVLQIEFENFKLNPSDPDKYYTHSFKVVGTKQLVGGTTDQYEDRPVADVMNDTQLVWKGVKHFLENLVGSPNYRSILNIPKEAQVKYLDLPEAGNPKERIEKYNAFFTFIADFVNGDGKDLKSQILDVEGKALPMWIKMTPNYDKDPKRNAKYYVINRFIGQGVFEPMKVDKGLPVGEPKIIRVKPTESLELKLTTAAAPGAAAAQGGALGNAPGGIAPEVANLLK